jgi:hypothetical protein
VVNKTKNDVTISGVRVSCGCVSAAAAKNDLKPGEETTILAKMDTTRFTGAKSVTIFVTLSRPNFEEVRLVVQANGRNDFTLNPGTFAMGQVKRGSTPSATVTLTFYGHRDAKVHSIKAESNYVKPEFKLKSRTDSQVVYELTATLRADTPVGKWYTDVWLKTNVVGVPQVRVPLTVDVASALSVNPDSVLLGKIKPGEEAERRVIIRGSKPFKIVKITGDTSGLTVSEGAPKKKAAHVLTVKYKSDKAKIGNVSFSVHVITDLGGDDGEIDFRVVGTVEP